MAETTAAQESGDRLPVEIWILVTGSFIVAVGMGIVSPALPAFATSFDVGVTATSFIVSAFAFMRLAFAPVSGRLVAWFGERPIYVWGISIVGVSSAACAFAGSFTRWSSTQCTASKASRVLAYLPSDPRA